VAAFAFIAALLIAFFFVAPFFASLTGKGAEGARQRMIGFARRIARGWQ
jgi:hypothetical protein